MTSDSSMNGRAIENAEEIAPALLPDTSNFKEIQHPSGDNVDAATFLDKKVREAMDCDVRDQLETSKHIQRDCSFEVIHDVFLPTVTSHSQFDEGDQFDSQSYCKRLKSNPNIVEEDTRLKDIIGHGALKSRIQEILLPLSLPCSVANSILKGIRSMPVSILLHGPPGCGKVSCKQVSCEVPSRS
jgi:hypothetical protein